MKTRNMYVSPKSARFLLLLLLAFPLRAEEPGDLAERIDSIASAAIREKRTAGLSLTVLQGARVVASRGYGSADLENDVPVTADTVFAIGSITKQFTAAAVLKLAEEGRLSLDDEVARLLPDAPAAWGAVKVRQLLNHTAGIRSMTRLGPRYWAQAGREIEPADLIAIFSAEPLDFPPGTRYAYSNSGYVLLGAILEKVTGKSYGTLLEESFFKPFALKRTFYGATSSLVKNRARGYSMDKEGFRNAWFVSLSQGFAAGGICSTSPGFDAQAVYFPDDDLTIVVLCNTDGDDIAVRIATDVARALLGVPGADARYGDHVVSAALPSP